MEKKRINFKQVFLFFLLFCAVIGIVVFLYARSTIRDGKGEAEIVASQVMDNILARIEDNSVHGQLLEAWLHFEGDETLAAIAEDETGEAFSERFKKMAEALYQEKYMFSVQLLPNGIIRYVYPEEPNAAVIGKEALTGSGVSEEDLIAAGGTGGVVLAGPEYVAHVGLSLMFYVPVFYENGDLWGCAAVVMKLPDGLKPQTLDRLDELGYQYELRCDTTGGSNERIAGTYNSIKGGISSEFEIQGTKWDLTIKPARGWLPVRWIVLSLLLIPGVSFLLAMVITLLKSRRDEKMAHLRSDARHDQMTNLLNHEASVAAIQQELETQDGGVLFIIDIDDFKKVNDTAGHLAGDQVLSGVAHALHTTFRRNDILGRYGGDEFIVYMLGYMSIPDFSVKASEFQRKIRKIQIGTTDRCITCSIGVARRCEETKTAEDLIRRADNALYVSKEGGKDRFTIFDDSDSTVIVGSKEDDEKKMNKKEFAIRE